MSLVDSLMPDIKTTRDDRANLAYAYNGTGRSLPEVYLYTRVNDLFEISKVSTSTPL